MEVQLLRIDAEASFRKQQIAEHNARTLEAIGNVEDFRDELEAVGDVERRGDDSRIVSKRGAEHLPQIALLGLGGNSGGRAGTLAIDNDNRDFRLRRQAKALAH